jgi:uncharacterized protein
VTNPQVFEHPEPLVDAWRQVRHICGDGLDTAHRTPYDVLSEFIALPGIHGNLVPDAHLAALAVEHGLCFTDGGACAISWTALA